MTESDRVNAAILAAREAGNAALDFFQKTGLRTELKPDQTLLSEADALAENIIRSHLEELFPDEPFIGEESCQEDTEARGTHALAADHAWVVDPIDGTNNFVAGLPAWCVSIAHLEKGVPANGVIFFPALNDELYFNVGELLFQQRTGPEGGLETTELEPMAPMDCGKPLFMAYDSFYWKHDLDLPHIPRISGCTVLNVLNVVLGRAIGASTSAHLWDFAAPLAFAPGKGVQMVAAFSGRVISRFKPGDFHLATADPKKRWRIREECLVAAETDLPRLRTAMKKRT